MGSALSSKVSGSFFYGHFVETVGPVVPNILFVRYCHSDDS